MTKYLGYLTTCGKPAERIESVERIVDPLCGN